VGEQAALMSTTPSGWVPVSRQEATATVSRSSIALPPTPAANAAPPTNAMTPAVAAATIARATGMVRGWSARMTAMVAVARRGSARLGGGCSLNLGEQ
jgi:hypothetical protein